MKKGILIILLALAANFGQAQMYSPSDHSLASKAMGFSQASPSDGRSMYLDKVNFKYRDFQSTTEALSYLSLATNRFGHFPIFVHSGGTLTNGTWTGGTMTAYWFKDGVSNSDLVVMNTGGGGTPTGFGLTSYGVDSTIIQTKSGYTNANYYSTTASSGQTVFTPGFNIPSPAASYQLFVNGVKISTGFTNNTTNITFASGKTAGDKVEIQLLGYGTGSTVSGVSSINGSTGAVTLKTVNGNSLTGSGDIPDRMGTKVFYLSKMGIPDDAILTAGSTTFGTDATAAIQAILDQGGTSHLIVHWDVPCSGTGWRIKSNTTIIVSPGCGAILRNNSNRPLIQNYNKSFGTRIDHDITIDGGIWNGNAYNIDFIHAQTKGTTQWGSTSVFAMYGVENLTIKNWTILWNRAYMIHGINIKNGLYENGVGDSGPETHYGNADGCHFDGNSVDCRGRNLNIKSGDDAICCTADDAYEDTGVLYFEGTTNGYYVGAQGPIKNVSWENIHFNDAVTGFRALSAGSSIDDIHCSNFTGTTKGLWCIMNPYTGVVASGPGNLGTITFENINVNHGDRTVFADGGAWIQSNAKRIVFRNLVRDNFVKSNIPTILLDGGVQIQELVLDGYYSNDASTYVTNHILMGNASIKRLITPNISINRSTGLNLSNFIRMDNNLSKIETWVFGSIIGDGISNILDNNHGGSVKFISGGSLMHLNTDQPSFVTSASVKSINIEGAVAKTLTSGTFNLKTGTAFNTGGYNDSNSTAAVPVNPYMTGFSAIPFPTTTNAAQTVSGSAIWQANNGVSGQGHYGLSNLKLAAGQDGAIGFYVGGADAYDAIITFNAANSQIPFTSFNAGASVTNSGGALKLVYFDAAHTSSNPDLVPGGSTIPAATWVVVRRTGSTLKMQTTTDGVTFTDVYTYYYSSTAELHVQFDVAGNPSKLYYPQGINLTP